MSSEDDDYQVGYGKPPRHSQFRPGESGNARGRPKGARGLKADLHNELAARHTIQINGKPVSGTRQQLMIMTLATRAASGDIKAAALLLPLIAQVFGFEDRGGDRQRLSSADQTLLDELLASETPVEAAPQPIKDKNDGTDDQQLAAPTGNIAHADAHAAADPDSDREIGDG